MFYAPFVGLSPLPPPSLSFFLHAHNIPFQRTRRHRCQIHNPTLQVARWSLSLTSARQLSPERFAFSQFRNYARLHHHDFPYYKCLSLAHTHASFKRKNNNNENGTIERSFKKRTQVKLSGTDGTTMLGIEAFPVYSPISKPSLSRFFRPSVRPPWLG